MTIALNIFLAGAVLIGIVTLLARAIIADEKANAATPAATPSPVQPATIRGARTREHRSTASRPTVGVH